MTHELEKRDRTISDDIAILPEQVVDSLSNGGDSPTKPVKKKKVGPRLVINIFNT